MKFIDLIRAILQERAEGATPQEIRDEIKANHADWYGPEGHQRNVDKGDLKWALIFEQAFKPGFILTCRTCSKELK